MAKLKDLEFLKKCLFYGPFTSEREVTEEADGMADTGVFSDERRGRREVPKLGLGKKKIANVFF